MDEQFDNKKFSEIGILSYLKGRDVNMIIGKFKEQAGKLQNRRRHEIRQKILNSNKFDKTHSLSGHLKTEHDRTPYTYQDELQAAILENCKNYHQFNIRYIAEVISKEGSFTCEQCGTPVQSTSQIVLDAFVASYFEKIKSYEGSTLIFKKEAIGSMFQVDKQKQAMQTQEKTLVASKESQGQYYIVQLKILQIDNNDSRVANNINTQKVAQDIQKITNQTKSKQFEERQLLNATNNFLINLICFKSSVRIRNPLIHKLCKPQDHKNRLILYSYEQIYSMIFAGGKKKKTIRCIYHPYCPNYFDQKNFFEMAVIVDNIHKLIYEQNKQCMYGEYFSGMYQKNWHFNYAQNMLFKYEKNRSLIRRYISEIRSNIQQLLLTASLETRKHIYKWIKESFQGSRQFDPSIKLSSVHKQDKIIIVDVGQSNICPVRCINCKNLNAIDAYKVSFFYQSNTERICPVCNTQCKKNKSFCLSFYLDLQLMQFIFLEGHNRQVLYNIKSKSYFHKLSFFTGRSLKQKLKQESKVNKGYLYQGDMDVKLPKTIKFVPFVDRRCIQKSLQSEYNKHIIYVNQNQKMRQDITCLHCNRVVRSDFLEYNEELQVKLRENGNELRWAACSQNQNRSFNAIIASIKYYNDIRNEYSIKEERRIIKFYWKNYQGTLIRYPFKFRGCNHSLETAICDFSDILYQSKVQKITQFSCRYKQCDKKYKYAEQLQRVSLDIYSKIEQSPQILRKIINNNQYWIQFNIQDLIITKTSKKYNEQADDQSQQDLIEIYRNKYFDSILDNKSRKEVGQNLKKVEQDIQYTQQKVQQDQIQFKKDKTYKHSQNDEQFQMLKRNLVSLQVKKRKLDVLKKQLTLKQMQQNRKHNKSNSINFTKLIMMYQPQVNRLKSKKYDEDPFEQYQPEDLSQFKTYGNLFPFKYPVPKTDKVIDLKDVEKAAQQLLKRQGKKGQKY